MAETTLNTEASSVTSDPPARVTDDEHRLVMAAKGGDKAAFYTLVTRYQKMVWRQSMRIARKAEIADELAQQTFLKAFNKLDTFREEAPFGAWLFRIAFNVARDWRRSHRRADLVEWQDRDSVVEAKSETDTGRAQELEKLRDAVEKLPEKQRQVVLLRVYEDFSFKEIATSMGGTEGTAKVNFHYAMKTLKTLMTQERGQP